MVYPPIMNMYMNNMSNMSNNMILAGHSKAVVSSQDGYQQALSEIDQLFSTRTEDEFINPDPSLLYSDLYSLGDCPMDIFDQLEKPQSCFDFVLLNESRDGCAMQDPSTNAATFSSESSAGFSTSPSPNSSEGFISSQVTFPASSTPTLQYIDGNDQLVQHPTRVTTPIPQQLNAEPPIYDNHYKFDLTDPNVLDHSLHQLNNTAAYDSNNLNPNAGSGNSDLFLSPLNVYPNNNDISLPSAFKLNRSVSPLSSDSGFASPPKLDSPQSNFQVNGLSDTSMIDGTSLFQGNLLYDTFDKDFYSSTKEPSYDTINIKPRLIPNKCTLKSTSALHVSKISKRKAGRSKLSQEEKYEKKKESDRKAAQRYRTKKAQKKKEQDERLAQLASNLKIMEGQLVAYKQVVRDSIISKFGIADLDDDKINLICSNLVSLCEGMSDFPTIL